MESITQSASSILYVLPHAGQFLCLYALKLAPQEGHMNFEIENAIPVFFERFFLMLTWNTLSFSLAFPFDSLVIEPCEGVLNSDWSKDDMIDRKVTCIIVVPKELADESWYGYDFAHWLGVDGVQKYYFGDQMEVEDAG